MMLINLISRQEGNGTRDPQSSNADSRPITRNALEKPCPSAEQQMPHSSRNEHESFSPRQKQIVLGAKKGGSRKGHFNRTFQAKWKKTCTWIC